MAITLKASGLNVPTEDTGWFSGLKKTNTLLACCLQKAHFRTKDTYILKVKGWKKIFYANRSRKKAGITILRSNKVDFNIETITSDKGAMNNDKRINPTRG